LIDQNDFVRKALNFDDTPSQVSLASDRLDRLQIASNSLIFSCGKTETSRLKLRPSGGAWHNLRLLSRQASHAKTTILLA